MSELALQLIRENKQKHARGKDAGSLDLGNCGLTEVPQEIGELVWLETLSFSNGWSHGNERNKINNAGHNNLRRLIPSVSALTNIKILLRGSFKPHPFSRLKNLKKLWISELSDLDDLTAVSWLTSLQVLDVSRTKVSDLTPLAGLASLQRLDVSQTQVSDLSPLSGLTTLQELQISETQVADLGPLAGLRSLRDLDVSRTKVSDLTLLSGLENLQRFIVRQTKVTDLYPLARLGSLQFLDASQTQLTDLTPLSGLASLQWLNVFANAGYRPRPAVRTRKFAVV